ncbi:hypothetical protein AMK59_3313, partial [Oryctes borbonicus]
TFTCNGINNCRNTYVRDVENPHAVRRNHYQHRFSINVWAGLENSQLIGSFLLPNRLNGYDYLLFLQNQLMELLEEVPLPHLNRLIRKPLDNVFENRWIGRGGTIPWPPRSPDLNLDFYLWGVMKTMAYTNEIIDLDNLRNRVEAAAAATPRPSKLYQFMNTSSETLRSITQR